MDKSTIRTKIQQQLRAMSEQQYERKCELISQQLIQDPSIIEGETIAVTISVFPEVDTKNLIKKFWDLGKTVVVPKCDMKSKQMDFIKLTDFNELQETKIGLLEPISGTIFESELIDVCIVPGIVFDQRGYRIGYGGGFYDRFLIDYNGHKVSIAFEQQLIEQVPIESHDIPIDTLYTERRRLEKDERGLLHEDND